MWLKYNCFALSLLLLPSVPSLPSREMMEKLDPEGCLESLWVSPGAWEAAAPLWSGAGCDQGALGVPWGSSCGAKQDPQFLQGLSFSCFKIQVNGWEFLCLNSSLLLLSPRGAYRGGKMLSDLVLLKSKLLGDSICSVANIWNLNPVILKVKLSLGWSLIFPACILHLDCLGIR